MERRSTRSSPRHPRPGASLPLKKSVTEKTEDTIKEDEGAKPSVEEEVAAVADDPKLQEAGAEAPPLEDSKQLAKDDEGGQPPPPPRDSEAAAAIGADTSDAKPSSTADATADDAGLAPLEAPTVEDMDMDDAPPVGAAEESIADPNSNEDPESAEKAARSSDRNYVNGVLMRKCQCRNPKDCRKIVAFWCQAPPDGSATPAIAAADGSTNKPKHRDGRRAGYMELPVHRKTAKTVFLELQNERRRLFFEYLTGSSSTADAAAATEARKAPRTREYVALHHFPPQALNPDGSGLRQERVDASTALAWNLSPRDMVQVPTHLPAGVQFSAAAATAALEGQNYHVTPSYPWASLVQEYVQSGGDVSQLQGPEEGSTGEGTTATAVGTNLIVGASPKAKLAMATGRVAAQLEESTVTNAYDRLALLQYRLEHKDATIAQQQETIAAKDSRIQEQDARIHEQDARIAEQDRRIAELESWTGLSAGGGSVAHPSANGHNNDNDSAAARKRPKVRL